MLLDRTEDSAQGMAMRKLYQSIQNTVGVRGSQSFLTTAAPGLGVNPVEYENAYDPITNPKGTLQTGLPPLRCNSLSAKYCPCVHTFQHPRPRAPARPHFSFHPLVRPPTHLTAPRRAAPHHARTHM